MHGNDVRFYKYLSPCSALAVLKEKQLKWSSPRLFNDPFDFPCEMNFPFSAEEFTEKLLEEIVHLVYGEEEPIGNLSNSLFLLANIARSKSNKPSENVYLDYMRPAMVETAERLIRDKDKLIAYYRDLRTRCAVLCLSEVYDDLLMWAHYAEKHSGCVLKLRCLPEMDRPICMAKQVVYQPEYPVRASLEDYVKHQTGQMTLNDDKLYEAFVLTKSDHWQYEKEWRCIGRLSDSDITIGFDFDPLIPEELEGIYLGCQIEEPTKETVLQLIKKDFPAANVYQSKIDTQKFRLRFDQIR
jgi:hypothetical protein